jgi:hypothetical protein
MDPSAQFPVQLRLQQYHACFTKYEATWEFSARQQGLLQEGGPPLNHTVVGALFLRPVLLDFTSVGQAQAAKLHFLPQVIWFKLGSHIPLKQVMLRVATAVDIEPSKLYFYYHGSQVNPQSTIAQVRHHLLLNFSKVLPLLASK